jgi:hypothetical protein
MFLTANRVMDFDEAIKSRIHFTLKYGALGVDTGKGIWKSFLETATTIKGEVIYAPEELHELARKRLNGREVSFVSHESFLSEIYADGSPIPHRKYCESSLEFREIAIGKL